MENRDLAFFNSNDYKWKLSISLAVFLYLFLIIFLPFGVSNYNPFHEYTLQFIFELSIFFFVVLVVALINEFLIKPLIEVSATVRSIVLWHIWSFLFLGVILFITYNYLGDWHDWRLLSGIEFIFNTSTVFIFPMVGVFFYYKFKVLKEQFDVVLTNIESSMDEKTMINFEGQGNNDKISISVSEFIYARSQDNYVELSYLHNNQLTSFLIRASMGLVEESVENGFIIRCHRSYMVNLFHVQSISGGKNDLQLFLNHVEKPIPVSKKYMVGTMEQLKKYKQFQ
ncbi:LytTR family DNA-binding domain-containing protein [Fulvivirga lutimaris]|uniref:LytTR family DNA-binding domain-containing protein n=1 Tax=Fulvivirga lutimaris TaxID=1819566 RepID=UPI0012BBF21E|nr:LytTR family DNA-binding domain-containing protein [Fulvivirga lutimaris]MTI41724.1 LytTR family transcriptional regulator [Fulvivirga lutimaris]